MRPRQTATTDGNERSPLPSSAGEGKASGQDAETARPEEVWADSSVAASFFAERLAKKRAASLTAKKSRLARVRKSQGFLNDRLYVKRLREQSRIHTRYIDLAITMGTTKETARHHCIKMGFNLKPKPRVVPKPKPVKVLLTPEQKKGRYLERDRIKRLAKMAAQ